MEKSDFMAFCSEKTRKPNPSNQNFHRKAIDSLALYSNVFVVSLLPIRGAIPKGKTGNPSYAYLAKSKLPFLRVKRILKEIKNINDVNHIDIIVFDSLCLAIAKASEIASKQLQIPRVAVCTDDPSLLSEASSSYINGVLDWSYEADGYLVLTDELGKLFNPKGKSQINEIGVVEEIPPSPSPFAKPYIYFGGALYRKYGTEALIQSFQESELDYDLFVSGHGPDASFIEKAAKENPRIHFLGQIDLDEHYRYLAHASLVLNPRIYMEEMDKRSVPSKLLEYLCVDATIISTKSSPIYEEFKESVNWLKCDDWQVSYALRNFYEAHKDKGGRLVGLKPNRGKEKIFKTHSKEAFGRRFCDFLTSLI